ncbi:MAG TPA: 4-hydroxythreonine-4-phosphate dehydrogenase PdxA [Lacipirellulaceae bacterium]|nr:4-hydroxythreonine-4-phosphate dehydrogenase PdxA [Lacipirellulaceae bacterium]
MTQPKQPLLAITMGDPAGVGPEVIVGAWRDARIHEAKRLIVLGHPEIMRRAARLLKRGLEVVEANANTLDDAVPGPNVLTCVKACDDTVLDLSPGQVDARAGEAAYQAVCLAANWALEKKIDGIVTAPLSKAALHAAGHRYPGHTELLAEICGINEFAMMLYLPPGEAVRSPCGLGVAHVTLHQSMRSVFDDLTPAAIVSKCRLADDVMGRLGVERPRIAVCALNPHAGEDGLFGDEELTIIAPAVEEVRRTGIDAAGPFPTDTLMMRARDGEFDAVVAMYHDQGHIALKLLGMHAAVNITLGLPIVRTSVAHGTAFDRAWQGTARSEGMVAAILTAAKLSRIARCWR